MSDLFEILKDEVPCRIDLKSRAEGDIAVVMNGDGVLEFLNRSASDLFWLVDGVKTVGELFELLVTEYDVDEEVLKNDLIDVIREMQWRRIIRLERAR